MKDKPKFTDHVSNFYDENGHEYLVYCPACGKENWAAAVATGQCAWCGWKEDVGKENEK